MHPTLTIAHRAALKAGEYIARAYERVDQIEIETKGRNNFVSEVDRNAESLIIKTLQEKFPEHRFLCEEQGAIGNLESDFEWVIDPLDGTSNFVHGFPHFCVSIALKNKGVVEQALIYDPIRQDEFMASRGRGAQCNGRRIRVAEAKKLEGTLIATEKAIELHKESLHQGYWNFVTDLSSEVAGVRTAGSSALGLAYVAAGKLDGFLGLGMQAWDFAAGALLIKEAGGMVVDPWGGESHQESGHVLAANPKLLKQLLRKSVEHLK